MSLLTTRTVYYYLKDTPIQFQVTAIMTVCWDVAVFTQRLFYGAEPPRGMIGQDESREEGERLRVGGHGSGY